MTVNMLDARYRRHPFVVRLFLWSKAAGCTLDTSRSLLAGRLSQGLLAQHNSLPIKGQHLNRFGIHVPLHIFRTGLGIKDVKVLGGALDNLLDLTRTNAHGGFRFNVMSNCVKGHLGGLGGHPFLQPMRVTTGGEIQLRIAWK
jgi:hypothetical protein